MTQEVKVIAGIAIVAVLLLVGGVFFLTKTTPSQQRATTGSSNIDSKLLVRKDSHAIATEGAQVTLVEFADLQCPACGAVYPTIKQILSDYNGKINFVFRHFPLTIHKNSQIAALALEAAGEQGKFFEMEDVLFEKQSEWSELSNPIDTFVSYATSLKLNTQQFKDAIENRKFIDTINRDQSDGFSLGVNATPTFFINQEKTSGVLSFDELKKKIDLELNK